MEIIVSEESINQLIKELPSDKIVVDFPIMGYLHKGHHEIIKIIKKDVDILIVNYFETLVELTRVLRNDRTKNKNGYYNILQSAEGNDAIDYLVINKIDFYPDHPTIIKQIKEKHYPVMKSLCNSLDIPEMIGIESMFPFFKDKFDDKISGTKTGAKYYLQSRLFQHLFGSSHYHINPISKPTLKFIKDSDGVVYGRFNSSERLHIPRKKIIESINEGIVELDVLNAILDKMFLPGKKFTIIDNEKIIKLNKINDNCTIILSDPFGYELMYIIDGEFIY